MEYYIESSAHSSRGSYNTAIPRFVRIAEGNLANVLMNEVVQIRSVLDDVLNLGYINNLVERLAAREVPSRSTVFSTDHRLQVRSHLTDADIQFARENPRTYRGHTGWK